MLRVRDLKYNWSKSQVFSLKKTAKYRSCTGVTSLCDYFLEPGIMKSRGSLNVLKNRDNFIKSFNIVFR